MLNILNFVVSFRPWKINVILTLKVLYQTNVQKSQVLS